ncbi:hypothetical protein BpHYR1_028587 [Brachionus plicatilis]|uniref:Peptidase A2 domain-containing protein n=1 Tax=Brachionus plicatilis TaxID=10195 RepID=A0A3M7R5L3_BRAPC|nr:hypothetical protein BpHYR1_028587 [Brachionus plicatilis]
MRDKLRGLRQSKDVGNYINDFRIILNQISEISEYDQITYFTQGLSELTENYVRLRNPESLQKAIEYAEDYNRFNTSRHLRNADILMINRKNFGNKFSKVRGKHFNYPFYNKKANNIRDTKKLYCKICRKDNHNTDSCYNNKKSKPKVDYKRGNNQKTKFKNKFNNVLHINELYKSNELLRHFTYIKGEKIETVFDTGATISLISLSVAKKLNLHINPSHQKINTADGNTHEVLGETDLIKIEIEETVAQLNFVITNILHIEILLGLDWFEQTKAIIDPSRRQLSIPGKRIRLNPKSEESDDDIEDDDLTNEIVELN